MLSSEAVSEETVKTMVECSARFKANGPSVSTDVMFTLYEIGLKKDTTYNIFYFLMGLPFLNNIPAICYYRDI